MGLRSTLPFSLPSSFTLMLSFFILHPGQSFKSIFLLFVCLHPPPHTFHKSKPCPLYISPPTFPLLPLFLIFTALITSIRLSVKYTSKTWGACCRLAPSDGGAPVDVWCSVLSLTLFFAYVHSTYITRRQSTAQWVRRNTGNPLIVWMKVSLVRSLASTLRSIKRDPS